jgi:hypothetical protein
MNILMSILNKMDTYAEKREETIDKINAFCLTKHFYLICLFFVVIAILENILMWDVIMRYYSKLFANLF